MLYHPDKHRDPELKRQAEQLFNQVHQAYEGEDAHRCKPFWSACKVNYASSGSGNENSQKQHGHKL